MERKEQTPENIHAGHRRRMKDRFLTQGLESFSDHEILELLLYYALPYKDTNDLAHALVSRYGSWIQVVGAHYDDLLTVPGVTPHVATLLTLVGQVALRYYRDYTGGVRQFCDTASIAAYAIPYFMGEREESVLLISMDNKCKHLNTTRIFRGGVNSAQFNVRMVVEQALRDNATQIAVAHNHPNGFAFPSRADVETTKYVMDALRPLDIRVVEHAVVAEGDCLCMSQLPDTKWLFDGSQPPEGFR